MSFWKLQLDEQKRNRPFRSSGLSRRFAFQVHYPEKEAMAWTVDFWVVQLDDQKRKLPVRSAVVSRKPRHLDKNYLHQKG
ncbi:hypothetical protein [Salimicrobium jeotgali]|nr:hypothetical protein [Salimicrobium jeotgali]